MPRLTKHATTFAHRDAIRANCLNRSEPWADSPRPEDEFKQKLMLIEAVVTDNYIDGSDPVLYVRSHDGRNWTVELGRRPQNERLGLTGAAAMPGDRIRVVGRRTRVFGEYRIKAVRLTIGDRTYRLHSPRLS